MKTSQKGPTLRLSRYVIFLQKKLKKQLTVASFIFHDQCKKFVHFASIENLLAAFSQVLNNLYATYLPINLTLGIFIPYANNKTV